jgi:hypothetical protein
MNTPTPTDPNGHEQAFEAMPEESRLVHLIEHGNWLRALRELDEAELDQLHSIGHSHGDGPKRTTPPDLDALADKAVRMAAGLREHVKHQRWSDAYAAADWLADLADEIHSHVWAGHPEARPDRW